MKSFIIKITEHLQNETTQDGLRNIFRDTLTGTTLMSVLAASATWLLKECNILAWLTLPLTLLLLFLIFFWGHYSIQTTVNKITPLKSKISSLCVMLFVSAFQLSILFSIIRIISGQ
ncbi:hypothetical protein F2H39_21910 [Salmonella enterica]|nr:hypothetical protein [Salmonella enterica]OZU55966.1 hypothetical protein CCO34_21165 [Salmonella enterica subsp. enterica serovar Hadar]